MHEFINNFVVFVSDFVTEKQISFDKGSVVHVRDVQDGIALVDSVYAKGAQYLIPVSVLRRPIDLVLAWEKAEPMPPSIYQRLRDRLAFTESAYLQVAENLGVPYPGWKDESDSHVCGQNVADVEERAAEANAALQCIKDLAERLACAPESGAIKSVVKQRLQDNEEIRANYRQACDDYARLAYILGVPKNEAITHVSRPCIAAIEERAKQRTATFEYLRTVATYMKCDADLDAIGTELQERNHAFQIIKDIAEEMQLGDRSMFGVKKTIIEIHNQVKQFVSWLDENHPIQHGDPCLPLVRATWVIERLSKELDARRKSLLGRDFTTKSKLAEFMSFRYKPTSFECLPDVDQTAWNHAIHLIMFLEHNTERFEAFVRDVGEKVGLADTALDSVSLQKLEHRLLSFVKFWKDTSITAHLLGSIELTQ